jgi:ParB-like chromosome segregation protein Spo0J
MKLSDLKPGKNPRKITKEQLETLKKSITDFKKMLKYRGIIIDENNVILGGTQRYQALKQLGYKDIPEEWIIHAEVMPVACITIFLHIFQSQLSY